MHKYAYILCMIFCVHMFFLEKCFVYTSVYMNIYLQYIKTKAYTYIYVCVLNIKMRCLWWRRSFYQVGVFFPFYTDFFYMHWLYTLADNFWNFSATFSFLCLSLLINHQTIHLGCFFHIFNIIKSFCLHIVHIHWL